MFQVDEAATEGSPHSQGIIPAFFEAARTIDNMYCILPCTSLLLSAIFINVVSYPPNNSMTYYYLHFTDEETEAQTG